MDIYIGYNNNLIFGNPFSKLRKINSKKAFNCSVLKKKSSLIHYSSSFMIRFWWLILSKCTASKYFVINSLLNPKRSPFLKALSSVRNLGHTVNHFTTINLDFLQHYRPRVNVVERPHAQAGGRGIALTGHHEIMIPLLAALVIERAGQAE